MISRAVLETKDEGQSPKGFFNPIISTQIFTQSRDPEGYFRHPTSHAYRKSSIKPPGGLFISNTFEGGIIETGGLFILAKTVDQFSIKNYNTK